MAPEGPQGKERHPGVIKAAFIEHLKFIMLSSSHELSAQIHTVDLEFIIPIS